jgi:hypothetical protein
VKEASAVFLKRPAARKEAKNFFCWGMGLAATTPMPEQNLF